MIYWCKSAGCDSNNANFKTWNVTLFHVVITALAPGYKIKLKTQSQHCFYLFWLLLRCSLSAPFDLQVATLSDTVAKCEGLEERESPPGLTYCSAWYLQLFTPWSTVSCSRDQSVFIYEGTKSHLSALSWSQWRCIVWLWGGEWIVFLPLGHTGTNPRQDIGVCNFLHRLHTLSASHHLTSWTLTCSQGHGPRLLRHNDLKIELL